MTMTEKIIKVNTALAEKQVMKKDLATRMGISNTELSNILNAKTDKLLDEAIVLIDAWR